MSDERPAALFVLDDRVVRYLIRTTVEIVTIVAVAAVVVGLTLDQTSHVWDVRAGFPILLLLALVLFGAGWALLKRVPNLIAAVLTSGGAMDVALDEGGIRFSAREGPTYWPLDEIDEPLVVGKWLGKVELVLSHNAEQRTARIVLFHRQAIVEAQWLGREVRRRLDRLRRDLPAGAHDLARAGADLATWRKRITSAVRADGARGAFRTAKLGPKQLAALAEDLDVPADTRAAAAYAWLQTAPRQAPARVAELINEGSPPLFVAMAALAATDQKLVSRTLLAAALAYVDDDIRRAALAAQRTR